MTMHGRAEAYLWVLEANVRARRFYERNGYKHDGTTKNAILGNVGLPELRYTKSLRE